MINLKTLAHIGLFLFVKSNEVTYFDSFGVEYTPEEIKNLLNLIPVGIKTSKQTYLEFKTYLDNSCVFYLLGL